MRLQVKVRGGMTIDVFSVQIEEKSKFLDLLRLHKHFVEQCCQIQITAIQQSQTKSLAAMKQFAPHQQLVSISWKFDGIHENERL